MRIKDDTIETDTEQVNIRDKKKRAKSPEKMWIGRE